MRIAARLLFAAGLIVSFAVLDAPEPGRAEVDDSVAIGCEFLFIGPSPVNGCDGVTQAEVATLAGTRGDEDGVLEAADLAEFDLDANQIRDGDGSYLGQLLIFAFVDNDGVVTLDADAGVTVQINYDGLALEGPDDANAETCEGDDDTDCGTFVLDDGDGVVVATITDATADAGDSVDVDVFQADDTNQVSTEQINVVGFPDEIAVVPFESVIEVAQDADDCLAEADVSDFGDVDDADKTFVAAVVTDNDGTELTRVVVDWSSSDTDIAEVADDTVVTVDAGVVGVAAFAVICGQTVRGTVSITAAFAEGGGEDATTEIVAAGEPSSVALAASPPAIVCNGSATSTITANVTDADGNPVADGTNVNFSVVAFGIANPINSGTSGGLAQSVITPVPQPSGGVTVIVSAGDAQTSIRIDCIAGLGASIGLTATPPSVVCDGDDTTVVSATVSDAQGELVLDGTPVRFDVYSVGVVTPINALTVAGIATTTFRGISQVTVGVPVFATSGTVEEALLLTCVGFDTDGDSIPNTYENAHPCLSANAPDATADPDGDLLNNRAEFLAGTDACVADTDADGCKDGAELLSVPSFGGDRDPLSSWDFYDVTGDGEIDLADTVAILQKFGLSPTAPGYVAAYDRYAPNAQKPYRTAQATGSHLGIDIADAVVNLQSFGHACV